MAALAGPTGTRYRHLARSFGDWDIHFVTIGDRLRSLDARFMGPPRPGEWPKFKRELAWRFIPTFAVVGTVVLVLLVISLF